MAEKRLRRGPATVTRSSAPQAALSSRSPLLCSPPSSLSPPRQQASPPTHPTRPEEGSQATFPHSAERSGLPSHAAHLVSPAGPHRPAPHTSRLAALRTPPLPHAAPTLARSRDRPQHAASGLAVRSTAPPPADDHWPLFLSGGSAGRRAVGGRAVAALLLAGRRRPAG